MTQYYYQFLEPVSKELAKTLQELEGTIFQSPRTMLTHSRTVVEAILEKVLAYEDMEYDASDTIYTRINQLDNENLLTPELKNSLHEIRKAGNLAAHELREFRTSESLASWEHLYIVVKWFVEVYGSHEIKVPKYVEPTIQSESTYALDEMLVRLRRLEEKLKNSTFTFAKESPSSINEVEVAGKSEQEKTHDFKQDMTKSEGPGFTIMREISFQGKTVGIPHFLRDAFLLPQKFDNSADYLRKLNEEEEARLMSELPSNLEALPQLPRRNDSHKATLLEDIEKFIQEEIRRKNLMKQRPGELFLFFGGDQIIVTEELGKEEINNERFPGVPGLIKQLNNYGIFHVRDLPKELVTLGKYQGVKKGRIRKFFDQLIQLQQELIDKQVEER